MTRLQSAATLLVLLVASVSAQLFTIGNLGNAAAPQTLRTVILQAQPQRVAVSQPQILAVAAPQPVRTVIARPFISQPAGQAVPITRPIVSQPVASFSSPADTGASSSSSSFSSSSSSNSNDQEDNGPPQPYSFSYDSDLEDGGSHRREESGDANGVVRGSYSYRDADGLFRTVDYVADQDGFRATVRTNEPGTLKTDPEPADVQMDVEPTPDAVLQKYASGSSSSFSAAAAPRAAAPIVAAPGPIAQPAQPAQPIQTLRLVAQPQPQPQTIRLVSTQPQAQSLRLQPQTQGIRLIPVTTNFLGGAAGRQAQASNIILLTHAHGHEHGHGHF